MLAIARPAARAPDAATPASATAAVPLARFPRRQICRAATGVAALTVAGVAVTGVCRRRIRRAEGRVRCYRKRGELRADQGQKRHVGGYGVAHGRRGHCSTAAWRDVDVDVAERVRCFDNICTLVEGEQSAVER